MRSALLAGLLLGCVAARGSEPAVPTIEGIIDARTNEVVRVRWGAAPWQLLAELRSVRDGSSRIELISAAAPVGQQVPGERLSVSNSGKYFAVLDQRKWIIRDSQQPNRTVVEIPDLAERRGLMPGPPPQWSRDDRALAFVDIEVYSPFEKREEAKDIQGVRVVDIGENLSSRRATASRVSIVSLHQPSTVSRQLTVPGGVITGVEWTPTGHLIIVSSSLDDFADPHTWVTEWDPKADRTTEILRQPGRMGQSVPRVSPDGKWLVLALDVDTRVWSEFVSLIVIDLTSGAQRRLTSSVYVAGNYVWSKDGRSITFLARNGGFDQVYSVDLQGTLRLVASGEHKHFDLQRSPTGESISYQTQDGYGRKDVRVRSLASGDERTLRTFANARDRFQLGKIEQIRWDNGQGDSIAGFLIYPRHFNPTVRYPLLVDVHGGGPGTPLLLWAPFTIGLDPAPLEWHVWASLGYVVFVPDYGSSGSYGQSAIARRYARNDLFGVVEDSNDVESGVRHVLRSGFIDPDRVGLIGHSAGGARAMVLLERSKLFRAAVLNEPINPRALENLIALTTGPMTGHRFEGMFATPLGGRLAERADFYTSGSLFEGYKISAPTLILVGDASHGAVPALSSEALFSVLTQYDVPTRMLRFVDEGHNYSTPQSATLAFSTAREWFEKYMPVARTSHE
jgi:dipeptidyl aminopeptidase/acylaminoacyl peptidase